MESSQPSNSQPSTSSKSQKCSSRKLDEAIVAFANHLSSTRQVQGQVDTVLRSQNDERQAWYHWMRLEAAKMSNDVWQAFRRESFNMVTRYCAQQQPRQSAQQPPQPQKP